MLSANKKTFCLHFSSPSLAILVAEIIYDQKSDNDVAEIRNSFNEDVQAWLMKLLSIFDCLLVTITFMKSFFHPCMSFFAAEGCQVEIKENSFLLSKQWMKEARM